MWKAVLSIFLAGSVVATAANASWANFGTVTEVYGANNGAILFTTSGTRTADQPSCQGPGLGQRFAIDASTTAGQALASVLLTAYTQHKRIYVQGTGACTIWGDTETVMFIRVED